MIYQSIISNTRNFPLECPFPGYTPCITYVNGNLVRCTNLNNNQNSKRKLANPTEKLAAASAEIGFQLSMLRLDGDWALTDYNGFIVRILIIIWPKRWHKPL